VAFVIAAAGRPSATLRLRARSAADERTQFLELPELPASLVFVGGGYVSFEFAHLVARAGHGPRSSSRLHGPLEPSTRILSRASCLAAARSNPWSRMRRFKPSTRLRPLPRRRSRMEALKRRSDADVSSTARAGFLILDGLDLDAGRVAHTRDGIEVNGYLQSTSNPARVRRGRLRGDGCPR